MSKIIGDLCKTTVDLNRGAKNRKNKYLESSIHNDQVTNSELDGWEVVRQSKTITRMRKPKTADVIFEDRVWTIFYSLGFPCMNKSRNCKLQFDSLTKQIDVLAIDEDNIFIVECRSSQSDEIVSAREALEYWDGKGEEAHKAIMAECGQKHGKINVVVAISSEEKRGVDEAYAKEIKNKNIFLWSAKELSYIEKLIRQVGSAARYQIYSLIFAGKKQSLLGKPCPAVRGKIGGHKFYAFVLPAKELIKYAYVHHRDLAGIIEASDVYQRMLNRKKLNEIAKFVAKENGYFPNSIIVNFTKPLQWNKKESFGEDIAIGVLELPQYFGSAWIIDGQHRLYGVAKTERDMLLPILAFDNIRQLDQANLFVEINQNQKKVEKDLLWDLYSDIYRDSDDDRQSQLFQIAETAKNMEMDGPLKGYIQIPSISAERPIKLSLTTVCDTINKYSGWSELKHPTDKSKTPENAARILNSYFEILKDLWPADWAEGNKGVLLSNNGFGVFVMVFHDILRFMKFKQQEDILKPSKTNEFKEILYKTYLTPLIDYLKGDEELQKSIKKGSSRGLQSNNAALLELGIREHVIDFWCARMESLPPKPANQKPSDIRDIEAKASRAEPVLREFVLQQIKLKYGSEIWWRRGLTGGAKARATQGWNGIIKRLPHMKNVENQDERKFHLLGLGDMVEIIVYGNNWNEIFQNIFEDKKNIIRRMEDIMVLRNPVSHTRQKEDQDVIDGIGGLLWLSRCIGKMELYPFVQE